MPPIWQSNGSTGIIGETLDVKGLTVSGPAKLGLVATATNVGDEDYPTWVNATLRVGGAPGIRINSITGDNNGPLNFHSIPRPDATNHYERAFTVKYTKPENSTVRKVKVTLSDGTKDLMTVLDEAPGGAAVKIIDKQTLKAKISHHNIRVC
ncbi:MAG: hypothetical protein LBD04_06715 [Synergistaceae bacterium]|nr:hypothetical protein [Synergistaceae bacterium]